MEKGLQRFLTAQEGKRGDNTLYELALKEIQEGKPSFECWVRYVYPQLKRSGTSQLTDFYGHFPYYINLRRGTRFLIVFYFNAKF